MLKKYNLNAIYSVLDTKNNRYIDFWYKKHLKNEIW